MAFGDEQLLEIEIVVDLAVERDDRAHFGIRERLACVFAEIEDLEAAVAEDDLIAREVAFAVRAAVHQSVRHRLDRFGQGRLAKIDDPRDAAHSTLLSPSTGSWAR